MQQNELLTLLIESNERLAQFLTEYTVSLRKLAATYEADDVVVSSKKENNVDDLRTEVKNIMQAKLKSNDMTRAELKTLITDMGKTALSDLDEAELTKLKTKLGE